MSLSASALLSTQSQSLLKKLTSSFKEGSSVYNTWKYMCLCFDTPRPSSKEELIRNKILEISKQLNLHAEVDAAGNVCVRKPATPGYENKVRIVVQSHLDMVCSKTTNSNHNFDTDSLEVSITEDGWVKANGTTLGADDGIGVAAGLMLLENRDFTHGPLECLFTVEEETTMDGAINLAKRPFLQAQALINVDSEEDNSICVGCAGGAEMKLSLPIQRTNKDTLVLSNHSWSKVTLDVYGLIGGHTGINIHNNRANAIKIMNSVLHDLSETKEGKNIHICSLTGGNAVNAIPRDAHAVIIVPTIDNEALVAQIQEIFSQYCAEYAYAEVKASLDDGATTEEEKARSQQALSKLTRASAIESCTMECNVNVTTLATNEELDEFLSEFSPISVESSLKIMELVEVIPHGVIRTSPEVEGDVDTSNALSLFNLHPKPVTGEDDVFWAHCFYRSFSDYQLKKVCKKLRSIAHLVGATYTEPFNYFNGWEPIVTSPLFHSVYNTHKKLFPHVPELRVYSVHAGLECGPIMNQYPDLHAVSIGPLIVSAHSPDEKMRIASVEPFVQWLVASIEQLSNVNADDFN